MNLHTLRSELPPMFCRTEVPRLFGGAISAGHLRNLDARGEGPPRVWLGRKVIYEREPFLVWLEARFVTMKLKKRHHRSKKQATK